MAHLAACFILVVGAALILGDSIGKDDGILDRQRRRITTPAPAFPCSTAKFADYNKKCCNVTAGDIFPANITTSCNKLVGGTDNLKYTKDYYLNSFQNTSTNIFSFGVTKTIKDLTKPAFSSESPVVGGTLDAEYMSTLLATAVPSVWIQPIKTAINDCKDPVNLIPERVIPNGNTTCSTLPLAMIQCVRFKLIGACPVQLEPVKPPKECAEGTNAQDHCNIFDIVTAMG